VNILQFIAAVAWPATVFVIAVMYRKPIYGLLHHMGGIAARAANEPFKATVGNIKLEFEQAVLAKNPKTIQDAVDAAVDVAKRLLPEGTRVPGKAHLSRITFLAWQIHQCGRIPSGNPQLRILTPTKFFSCPITDQLGS
jgi:hypothetical protein